jgi:lipopolysaccharide export system protein LptA
MTFSRAVLCAVLSLAIAGPLAAQIGPAPSGRCQFVFDNIPTSHLQTIKLPSGQYNSYIGGGVVARCPSQALVLRSDSLETYGDEGRFFFIGHVDYTEPRLTLKSDFLTYFQREERLLAMINVDATLPSGSNLKGPQLEFWRAIPRVREQHATAIGRPTISVVEKDSAGRPQPPVTVTGNNVWLVTDSVVASSGQVVVVRPELTASGDSLFLDGGTGLLRMMRNPRVVGTKGRPFTLVGETIDVLSRQRKLDRVLAKLKAEAVSQDVNLKSDTIDLRIIGDELQRAIAWGKSRAHAVSTAQSIIADSIDVLMPKQRLQEMHAVGQAVAEGAADTTRFHTPERDRLTGDTIVAHFDSSASQLRDTTSKPRIRLLVAKSKATSLQHLPPRDTTLRTPAVVYVIGREIQVEFDSGAVRRVVVKDKDLASGLYLEPEDTTRSRRQARGTGRPGATPGGPARPAGNPPGTPPTSTPTPAPVAGPPTSAPPRRP